MNWRYMALIGVAVQAVATLTGCSAGTKITVADMDFVWCPSGDYYMGSRSGEDDELPVHHVTFSKGFWMSTTEITQEVWVDIMGSNPCDMTGDPRLPVDSVSWEDVQSFIAKLNDAHPLKNFRLPTEAEWEYACRADTSSSYFFGTDSSDLSAYAWYTLNSSESTQLVGQKEPNDWGLYDMYGNVGEWVSDWYGEYAEDGGSETDPQGPETGSKKVYRGGSWDHDAVDCRSSKRLCTSPDRCVNKIGFRLVLE